jgi:tRNA(fMet)-specific endonuclease VapC
MFLFDTDHFGIFQQRQGQEFVRLKSKLLAVPQESLLVPIVCFHEQILGWTAFLNRSPSQDNVVRAYGRLRAILDDFAEAQIAVFDESAAQIFEELRASRVRVGTMDLRIASIAKSRDWTVLTRNTVDFARVPGLKYEDWCSS